MLKFRIRDVYNYFVLRTKMNGVELPQPMLPSKLSHVHDFDSNWHADPLYETDTTYELLNSTLKESLIRMMNKYVENKNPVYPSGKIDIGVLHQLFDRLHKILMIYFNRSF